MNPRPTVWNGDNSQLERLKAAIANNCKCAEMSTTCPAHKLLLDQDTMNRLDFLDHWARQHNENCQDDAA